MNPTLHQACQSVASEIDKLYAEAYDSVHWPDESTVVGLMEKHLLPLFTPSQDAGTSMNPISLKIRTLEKQYNDTQIELTEALTTNAQLRARLEEAERLLQSCADTANEQNVALYDSRPVGSLETQSKYVALDKWKKAYQAITNFLTTKEK